LEAEDTIQILKKDIDDQASSFEGMIKERDDSIAKVSNTNMYL